MITYPEATIQACLKSGMKVADHFGDVTKMVNMGSGAAFNLFRATQAEEKLKRENVQSKKQANSTHYEVGKKVRQTIQELGGAMPEDMPTPTQSVKQIENAKKKLGKIGNLL